MQAGMMENGMGYETRKSRQEVVLCVFPCVARSLGLMSVAWLNESGKNANKNCASRFITYKKKSVG